MTILERIRRRVPLVVFVLLFVLLIMMVAIACACANGDAMQQANGAGTPLVWMPGLIDCWLPLVTLAGFLTAIVVVVRATGRASPIVTQRFLI